MKALNDHTSSDPFGRTAVVTGAGRGIGRMCALILATRGYNVAVWDMDGGTAAQVESEIAAAGGHAIALAPDVSDFSQVVAAGHTVIDSLGDPSILVNCAGVFGLKPILELESRDFYRMLDVHVLGILHTVKVFVPAMLEASYGRIVNIASSGFETGLFAHAHYAAAKGAVVGLTRSLAREFGQHLITCNAVSPGNIDTGNPVMQARRASDPEFYSRWASELPIRRLGRPEDVAHLVAFLVSDEAGYITGQTIRVDGGLLMA